MSASRHPARAAAAALLALALVMAAFRADAQPPPRMPRVGVLEANPGFDAAFEEGLRQLGYVDGKTVAIEWRRAHASPERFPELAAELVRRKVDVIVATNNPAAAAAKKATTTIPIVTVLVTDPVRLGLVASLARLSGNVTGLTIQSPDLSGKRLQLLKEAIPRLTRVAVLWDSNEPGRREVVKETEATAPKLGLRVQTLEVRHPDEIGTAFTAITRERAGAVLVYGSSIAYAHRVTITDLAARSRVPAMSPVSEWMDADFVMAYGPSLNNMYRRAAYFVDKILAGTRPADLPIEQPTRFTLAINTRVAKALGLTMSPSLLGRADRIIE